VKDFRKFKWLSLKHLDTAIVHQFESIVFLFMEQETAPYNIIFISGKQTPKTYKDAQKKKV
jgi:hypothetical protein